MKFAIDETERRRAIQTKYNEEHGIVPATIRRAILDINPANGQSDYYAVPKAPSSASKKSTSKKPEKRAAPLTPERERFERIEALRQEMFAAAENLQFETAARLRDELKRLQNEGRSSEGAVARTEGGQRKNSHGRDKTDNSKTRRSRGAGARKRR
jgi:excinuclease ABC subunit B